MKLTEVKYTKRFNLGQYEHEEITLSAAPEMGETADQVLHILKMVVEGSPRVKTQTQPTVTTNVTLPAANTASRPVPPPPPVDSLGAYVINIGKKHKGKRLDEMDLFELDGFCKWLTKDGPPKGATIDFLSKAEAYLKSREKPRQQR